MSDENLNMILRNVILSVFCHLSTVKEVTLTIRFGSLFYYYVFPEPCILFHIPMMVNTFGYLLYEQLWRCQRGIQKPQVEEGQTIQWLKPRGQHDKDQQNTTQKTRNWTTRSPLKTGRGVNSGALER